jgi:RND family efflux transporter MFP subunit
MTTHASLPPTTDKATVSAPPARTSALGKVVVALLVVGLAVPLGAKISSALQTKKALDDGRSKSAAEAAAKASAPPTMKVVGPTAATWAPAIPFDGSLAAIHEASLAFKATGPIASLRVKVGDYVQKGAVLAALDATEAAAQARAAAAQIKAAEAQLALAKDNETRTSAMVKSGAVAEAQGTQSKGQLDLTAAQLESAQAQLALSNALIRNHTLVAPFAGWVTLAPTGVGGLAAAGQPLFQLKDVSRLRLLGTVSEQDVSLVKLGAAVEVRIPGRKEIVAKVTAILPAVDPATRRIPVEAELENDQANPIAAGTFARAAISGGAPIEVLRLPATTLRPGSQDEILVVERKLADSVDGTGENATLRATKILFARDAEGALLVRSGLARGEDVLLTPAAEAKTGDRIVVAK